MLADSVGLALYVVMDALTPAERVSFVLHDVFEIPFDAIAAILGPQHPGREDARHPGPRADPPGRADDQRGRGRPGGRRGVPGGGGAGRPRGAARGARSRGGAAGSGPQGPYVVRGAEQIARGARVGAHPGALVRPAVVDGLPGLLVIADGKPVTVLAFTVADGVVTTIRALTDPGRLAQIVPSWVA